MCYIRQFIHLWFKGIDRLHVVPNLYDVLFSDEHKPYSEKCLSSFLFDLFIYFLSKNESVGSKVVKMNYVLCHEGTEEM